MNIVNLNENAYYLKSGDFYADILRDEGPTAIIVKINADESEDIMDEYNIPEEYVKLVEANNDRDVPSEMEYDAFIKWLESHNDIETIYITPFLMRYFYFPFEDEVYIDPVDGFAKFPDSDE